MLKCSASVIEHFWLVLFTNYIEHITSWNFWATTLYYFCLSIETVESLKRLCSTFLTTYNVRKTFRLNKILKFCFLLGATLSRWHLSKLFRNLLDAIHVWRLIKWRDKNVVLNLSSRIAQGPFIVNKSETKQYNSY